MKKKRLIITHITHLEIHKDELPLDGLGTKEQRVWIEVRPFLQEENVDFGQQDFDWNEAKRRQQKIFDQEIKPHLKDNPEIVYFSGQVPIPLTLHLGSLLNDQQRLVKAYTRHRDTKEWYFDTPLKKKKDAKIKFPQLPDVGSSDTGGVIIRLSVSLPIYPQDTRGVVKNCLGEFDLTVQDPYHDILSSEASRVEFTNAFFKLLSKLSKLYENAQFHVFAAMPTGLTFLIGSRRNPNMWPAIQTYQYKHSARPKYKPAILLTDAYAAQTNNDLPKKVLVITADKQQDLHVTPEAKEIQVLLMERAKLRDCYKVTFEPEATMEDLIAKLRQIQPHIVHIASHGNRLGPHLYEGVRGGNVSGTPYDSTAEIEKAWVRLFNKYSMVECVILNACYSSELAQKIAEKIRYVIGFDHGVADINALRFSHSFYRSLGDDYNIKKAFQDGNVGIGLPGGNATGCKLYIQGKEWLGE
ncbi:hypothetical protein BKI52_15820 [marine bacterium AO1-C]|nr:hypothetical protein BKI52_15820 [marine bacterium AO1-C]